MVLYARLNNAVAAITTASSCPALRTKAVNINTRVFINQSEEGEVDKYPLPIGYAVIYYGLPVIDWTMD